MKGKKTKVRNKRREVERNGIEEGMREEEK